MRPSAHRRAIVVFGSTLAALALSPGDALAAPPPVALGAAGPFAVFAATTVTNTGASTVNGDLGVSPGTAMTGFGSPAVVNGTMHAGDGPAAAAHTNLVTAYADAAGRAPSPDAIGALGGVTLTPGVYASGSTLTLAGTLTLDAEGDPDAVFILQAGSTLGTGANSDVALVGGAQACNVFWQVGSSATLGANSSLAGSILAMTSITLGAGVTIEGRALARDAAVTMDDDTVSVPACAGPLSNTAPAITAFAATLTGLSQTIHALVGAWSVTDARDSSAGYSITVSATAPTVNGSGAMAGTGGSLTLTPKTATAAAGNLAPTGPVARSPQPLGPDATTIENAVPGTGQGTWEFPADAVGTGSLAVRIPGDAGAGAYRSTLTFTTAPPAS
jgi:hypothetical protein